MEDPKKEIGEVIRALVDKPTLKRQKETLETYFTEDAKFYHFYINLDTGLRALIAIYQMAELLVNYSGVDLHNILYDAEANAIAVRMTVYIRPWLLLRHTIPLKLHTLLELEDVTVNGQKVKKIRVQRDYFIRAPVVESIPIIGYLYTIEFPRFVLGNTLALIIQFILRLIDYLWHGLLGL